MAGFTSFDEILNAISVNGLAQFLQYQKTLVSTNVASIWHTLWTAGGIPTAGSYPTAGLANGALLTKSTTGALPFTNPTNPATMHLLAAGATNYNGGGLLLLVDRICHVRFARNQATGSITGMDATSRLASGDGGLIVLEVATALGTGGTARTFTYTNQAGTGSKVTQSITDVASAVAGRSATTVLFVPLADGDSGVRSIESTTLGATGVATGEIVASIVRPLALISAPTQFNWYERDMIFELPNLSRIFSDSCISGFFVAPGASGTFTWNAMLRICEN